MAVQAALGTSGLAPDRLELKIIQSTLLMINRSFVAGLGLEAELGAVIRTIAAIGSGFGMTAIAEGAEMEQAAQGGDVGCTDIQGHLIGRPTPATKTAALLRQQAPATDQTTTTTWEYGHP